MPSQLPDGRILCARELVTRDFHFMTVTPVVAQVEPTATNVRLPVGCCVAGYRLCFQESVIDYRVMPVIGYDSDIRLSNTERTRCVTDGAVVP